jgi:hypothetical protein
MLDVKHLFKIETSGRVKKKSPTRKSMDRSIEIISFMIFNSKFMKDLSRNYRLNNLNKA